MILRVIVPILVVFVLGWGLLADACYWHWKQVGKRVGDPFVLPSWQGFLLLPVWTLRAWAMASAWGLRWRLRRRIRKLGRLENAAGPDTQPEILARLHSEIARLKKLAQHKRSSDATLR